MRDSLLSLEHAVQCTDNISSLIYSLFLGTNHSESASKWMKNRSNPTESSKQIHTVNTNYKVAAQQLEAASLRNPATCHSTAERTAIDLKQQAAVLTQTLTHSLSQIPKQYSAQSCEHKRQSRSTVARSSKLSQLCHSTAERTAIDLKQQAAVLTQTLTHSVRSQNSTQLEAASRL